jgi:hypothetical protein
MVSFTLWDVLLESFPGIILKLLTNLGNPLLSAIDLPLHVHIIGFFASISFILTIGAISGTYTDMTDKESIQGAGFFGIVTVVLIFFFFQQLPNVSTLQQHQIGFGSWVFLIFSVILLIKGSVWKEN